MVTPDQQASSGCGTEANEVVASFHGLHAKDQAADDLGDSTLDGFNASSGCSKRER
jgi:hypothetical protein